MGKGVAHKGRYTQEEVLALCVNKYGTKYDYSKMVYVNNAIPFIVICPIHGEFSIVAGEHFRKRSSGGCRKCGLEYTASLKRISIDTIRFRLAAIQPTAYTFPRLEEEYFNTKSRITLHCTVCGRDTPELDISNLIKYPYSCRRCIPSGRGCRKYVGVPSKKRYTTEDFIRLSKSIHGDVYDYSNSVYISSHEYVTIVCPVHGELKIKGYLHLQGQGCAKCNHKIGAKKRLRSREEWLASVNKVHSGFYIYDNTEYIGAAHKVNVLCPEHGVFRVKAQRHEQGDGCPRCTSSLNEKKIDKYLTDRGIAFTTQKTFYDCKDKARLKFDFFLSDFNVFIEFHGEQHYNYVNFFHRNLSNFEAYQRRDKIKKEYAQSHGTFLEIKYDENVEAVLDKFFENYYLNQEEN